MIHFNFYNQILKKTLQRNISNKNYLILWRTFNDNLDLILDEDYEIISKSFYFLK